jgi:hypothetical protein
MNDDGFSMSMRSSNSLAAKANLLIAHPMTWLIVSLLALGIFRSLTIPPYHNYDEFYHFRSSDPNSFGITDCLRRQDCRTLSIYFSIGIPQITRIDAYRGLPYYFLQAFLQALLPDWLDGVQHLIAARFFTVFLSALFIATVCKLAQEVFPYQPLLAALSGIFASFVPAFSDILSSVNLDAPSALMGVIVVYTSISLMKHGITLRLLCVIVAEAVIGYVLKGTVWPLFLLFAPGFVVRLPAFYRNLLVVSLGVITITSILVILQSTWFGAAKWFYPLPRSTPNLLLPNQIQQDSVVGKYSLETTSHYHKIFRDVPFSFVSSLPSNDPSGSKSIIQILPEEIVSRLRGRQVTFGVWARAAGDEAIVLNPYCQTDQIDVMRRDIQLTSRWEFYSFVYSVPMSAVRMYCALGVPARNGVAWYDGMILAEGEFANSAPLIYRDPESASGIWGENTFVNLLSNSSAEQLWLQVDPGLGYPFSVNQRIVSFLSWKLTGSSWMNLIRWSFVSFWATFGGEQPGLSPRQMIPFVVVTIIAIAGVTWTIISDLPRRQRDFGREISRRGFWILVFAVLSIGLLIIYRADIVPFRPVIFDFSSMRHASASWSAISILLALGLLRLAPKRHHKFFIAAMAIFLFAINMHIFLRVQLPLYNCIYNSPEPGGQSCLWLLPLE